VPSGRCRQHAVENLLEPLGDAFRSMSGGGLLIARVSKALPLCAVCQKVRDPVCQLLGGVCDQNMVAMAELDALGADRGGDYGSPGRQRLEDLPLDARAVQQRDDRDPRTLEVRHDGRDPANHPDVRQSSAHRGDARVQTAADHVHGVRSEKGRIEPG
jgi:hypothetical protein